MNPYNIDFTQLSADDQVYFKSEEYRSLSPSARIQIAKERLVSKPTAEEVQLKKQQEDEGLRRVYEARAKAEEVRQATVREHQAERKRRYLA